VHCQKSPRFQKAFCLPSLMYAPRPYCWFILTYATGFPRNTLSNDCSLLFNRGVGNVGFPGFGLLKRQAHFWLSVFSRSLEELWPGRRDLNSGPPAPQPRNRRATVRWLAVRSIVYAGLGVCIRSLQAPKKQFMHFCVHTRAAAEREQIKASPSRESVPYRWLPGRDSACERGGARRHQSAEQGFKPGLDKPKQDKNLCAALGKSLLRAGLRLPGGRCRFCGGMVSIMPSHGLRNLLRGELRVIGRMQDIVWYVCFGFHFGYRLSSLLR
jgi:hypothetical protein